jgi:hypothetical protein
VTSSDLYLALAAQDEQNKPSPYFRAIVLEQRRGTAAQPPSELAKLVMENRSKRRVHA